MITLVCGNLIWKCEVELASVQFEMNIRYRNSNCNAVPPQSSFRYRRRWKGLLQGFHPCHGFRQRAVLSKCRWPERCLDRSMIKILLVEGWPLRAGPLRFSSTFEYVQCIFSKDLILYSIYLGNMILWHVTSMLDDLEGDLVLEKLLWNCELH